MEIFNYFLGLILNYIYTEHPYHKRKTAPAFPFSIYMVCNPQRETAEYYYFVRYAMCLYSEV